MFARGLYFQCLRVYGPDGEPGGWELSFCAGSLRRDIIWPIRYDSIFYEIISGATT